MLSRHQHPILIQRVAQELNRVQARELCARDFPGAVVLALQEAQFFRRLFRAMLAAGKVDPVFISGTLCARLAVSTDVPPPLPRVAPCPPTEMLGRALIVPQTPRLCNDFNRVRRPAAKQLWIRHRGRPAVGATPTEERRQCEDCHLSGEPHHRPR